MRKCRSPVILNLSLERRTALKKVNISQHLDNKLTPPENHTKIEIAFWDLLNSRQNLDFPHPITFKLHSSTNTICSRPPSFPLLFLLQVMLVDQGDGQFEPELA